MVQVPIPSIKYVDQICYFMQYDLNNPNYSNFKIEINIKDEETLEEFRKRIEEKYEIPAGSFLITYVSDQ